MVDPDLQVAMDAVTAGVEGAESRLLALLLERRDGPAQGLHAASGLDELFGGFNGSVGDLLSRRRSPSPNPARPSPRRSDAKPTPRPTGPEWHSILPVE